MENRYLYMTIYVGLTVRKYYIASILTINYNYY